MSLIENISIKTYNATERVLYMNRCEQCEMEVVEGSGVDHELNENEVIVFCSMDHFKVWIDKHLLTGDVR